MFWAQGATNGSLDLAALGRHCQAAWGVAPRALHTIAQFGGNEVGPGWGGEGLRTCSNLLVAFSCQMRVPSGQSNVMQQGC